MSPFENHEVFLQVVQSDADFTAWVDSVSPRVSVAPSVPAIQQVWIAELFLVLKILWEIYQILKAKGWFKAWFETRKVKRAMRNLRTADKEIALMKVRDGLTHQVSR